MDANSDLFADTHQSVELAEKMAKPSRKRKYANPWGDQSPVVADAWLPGMGEDLSALTDAQIEDFWGRFIDDLLAGLRYEHSVEYAEAVCEFLESKTGAALVCMTHGVRGGDFADLLRSHLAAQKRRRVHH